MRRGLEKVERARRVDVRRPVTLINSDGVAFAATLLDLSSGGFRVEVPEAQLRIGEHATIRADRLGDMAAEIRWTLGGETGGVFLQRPELA